MWVLCWSLFWYALFYNLSSFAILLTWNRELVALLLISFVCLVTVNVLWLFFTLPWVGLQCATVVFPDLTYLLFIVNVLWLFLTVPWVDLQCVIVVFPDHTHLLFGTSKMHLSPHTQPSDFGC